MQKYGKWSEQESTLFRTSGDNKVLTITPPSSLTGASLTLTLPDVSGTADTLISRISSDTGANRLQNKELSDDSVLFVDNADTTKKLALHLSGITTATTRTWTLPDASSTFVGTDVTQTLTGKTIDGDNNTVQDLALSTLKTTGNTNVFLQRDGSGNVIDSTKAVPTGDVVGTSDSQTLTNKTIDGDNNTVQDLALTSLKTTANLDVFLQRNGSGVVIDSAKSVPTGDVVGSSDAQTLTNKTLSDFLYDSANVSITANAIPVGTATILRITAGTGPVNTMTGGANGDVKVLVNELGSSLTITNDSGADGFVSGTANNVVVNDDASITVIYNSTLSRWQIVGISKADNAITTQGDVIIGDANGEAARLGIGASGTVLTSNGTTASWQTPAGTGDVTAAANIADNRIVRGDGGAKGIQQSGVSIDDSDNVTGAADLTVSGVISTSAGYVQGTTSAKAASYTVLDNDGIATVLMTTGAADRTVTLPTAADNAGRQITIKKVDSNATETACIVDGEGVETIDGATTVELWAQNDYITVVSDGTEWHELSSVIATRDGKKAYEAGNTYNGVALNVTDDRGGTLASSNAQFVLYKTDLAWRIRFNIYRQWTGLGATTSTQVTIAGVTFKATYAQSVDSLTAGTSPFTSSSQTVANTGNINVYHTSNSGAVAIQITGDVELESLPTWAEALA